MNWVVNDIQYASVVSKQSHFTRKTWSDVVIYVNQEQEGSENRALRHPSLDGKPGRRLTLNSNSLEAIRKIAFNPGNKMIGYAKLFKFKKKSRMPYLVESFRDVKEYHSGLFR